MKVGVVTFPGSLDDRDAARAVRARRRRGRRPLARRRRPARASTRSSCPAASPTATTCAAAPSPGSRRSWTRSSPRAQGGLPVLGICNGFQVLTESHLLPGALIRNDHRKFICRDQGLAVENAVDRVDLATSRPARRSRSRSRTARAASSPTSARSTSSRARAASSFRYARAGQPQRLLPRHRRHHQRARQRRRPHAAPRARGRGGLRPDTDGLGFFTSILKQTLESAATA